MKWWNAAGAKVIDVEMEGSSAVTTKYARICLGERIAETVRVADRYDIYLVKEKAIC